ncbi:hypothetical protein [Deinococcus misasensis]|uniref:hypothetical protein n=1 Tax=Deinococcus misasensis TaxID=392413 RepID=UPI00054F8BD6|nr:hypothetical protein [Deinococcus misasensis]
MKTQHTTYYHTLYTDGLHGTHRHTPFKPFTREHIAFTIGEAHKNTDLPLNPEQLQYALEHMLKLHTQKHPETSRPYIFLDRKLSQFAPNWTPYITLTHTHHTEKTFGEESEPSGVTLTLPQALWDTLLAPHVHTLEQHATFIAGDLYWFKSTEPAGSIHYIHAHLNTQVPMIKVIFE